MIREIRIEVNAAYPETPLEAVSVFAGSAATITVAGVPRTLGKRTITGLKLNYKTIGGMIESVTAVKVASVYSATIPAMAQPYSATLGVKVVAVGKNEADVACEWIIGAADLVVLNAQGQVTPGAEAGDMSHSEFAAITALESATLKETSAKVNEILAKLKGTASALMLFAALPLLGDLGPNTEFGDVPPDAKLSAVVAAGGGGGSGIGTNEVQDIVESYGYVTDSVTNGLASKVYVDDAVAAATPADYANVSNKAVNAVQTNHLGSVTFGNDFGAIEYNAPNVEGLENWIKITKNALVEVGENGVGDVWIGSTSGNSQYVNLKVGKNRLWTEADGEYSGVLWDWHTNSYTRLEVDTKDAGILSSAASDAQSRVDTATKSFTSYSWIRPDDWYVTFSSSNQFPSVTWVGETENDSGQIFSNEVRTVTHSIGGCASWENIDPNSTNYAPVEAWASYDAALTINGNGEFTAASNGLYRISAKRGNDYRYADVAAQILPAEVTTNMIYMRDSAASARKSVNDAAKTILQNATLVSSAGYNTYNTFKYHMTGAAAGNVKPFAVSAHVLVGASHYAVKPTGCQYFNDGNGHSANVYKLPWVSLSDWAATNGFSQVEISEANINDLYMIPCDKSTAVPDGCIPWFMSEYTAKEKFGSTMIGLQAWFAPQDHEYAVPCVLNSINGIAMRYSPSYYTEPLTRADICPILRDMGTQYQIKGGDSGRPMWINIDNKPVVLCGFHFGGGGSAGGGGENLMRGFNIIKAFVEWYGDTIKEYK